MDSTPDTAETIPLPSKRITSAEFAAAVYSGLGSDVRASVNLNAPGIAYWIWRGNIPGTAVGTYWVPNLYRVEAVRRAANDVHPGESAPRGLSRVLTSRTGLRGDDIGVYCVAYAEIDDIPLPEQHARWDWFEQETCLRRAGIVLSGDTSAEGVAAAGVDPKDVVPGKSVHSFIALRPTDLATWTSIQKHLVVVLRSDPSIINPDRLMRLGGVVGRRSGADGGPCRVQTALRAEANPYDAEDVLSRLKVAAAREGVADVDAAYDALQFASVTRKSAKKHESAAPELVEIAETIIKTRAVTDDQVARVRALTGGLVSPGQKSTKSGAAGLGSTVHDLPADTIVHLADGRSVGLMDASTPEAGLRCYDPVLETPGQSSPSARLYPGGRIYSEAGGGRTSYHVATEALPDGVFGFDGAVVEPAPVDIPASPLARWETPEVPFAPGKVIFLKGPTGSRKTGAVADLAKILKVERKRLLTVGPTTRLTKTLSQRMGTDLYSDTKTGKLVADFLAVCLPSLGRVPLVHKGRPNIYAVIHLDEIEELLGLLHSPEIMTRWTTDRETGRQVRTSLSGRLFHALSCHLKATLDSGGMVIVSDAYCSGRLIVDMIRLTGRGLEDFIEVEPPLGYRDLAGSTESKHPKFASLLKAILGRAEAGLGGTIACDTAERVRQLAALIREVQPAAKILDIYSGSEATGWESGVSAAWDQHDWVIYNQAAGSGVSYEGTRHTVHFEAAQVFMGVTWSMLLQLRARNRIAAEHHSWIAPTVFGCVTDHELIDADLTAKASQTVEFAYRGIIDGEPSYGPAEPLHFASYVDNEWIHRLRSHAPAKGYYNDLTTRGCVVTSIGEDCSLKALEEHAAALYESIKVKDVERVAAATRLTVRAFQDLTADSAERKPQDVRDAITQFITVDRWGTSAVPSNENENAKRLIRDTLAQGSPKWQTAKRFQSLVALSSGDPEIIARVKRGDRAKLGDADCYRGQASHTTSQARIGLEIFDLAGLPVTSFAALTKPEVDSPVYGLLDLDLGQSGPSRMGVDPQEDQPPIRDGSLEEEKPIPIWSASYFSHIGFVAKLRDADRRTRGALGRHFGSLPKNDEEAASFFGLVLRRYGIPVKRARTGAGTGEDGSTRGRTIDREKLSAWQSACERGLAKLAGQQVEQVDVLTGAAAAEARVAFEASADAELEDLFGGYTSMPGRTVSTEPMLLSDVEIVPHVITRSQSRLEEPSVFDLFEAAARTQAVFG